MLRGRKGFAFWLTVVVAVYLASAGVTAAPQRSHSALRNTLNNPLLADAQALMVRNEAQGWAAYNDIVEAGRVVYARNCFYCHAPLTNDRASVMHTFNPQFSHFPASGSLTELRKAYLFWRSSGKDSSQANLPEKSMPWSTAVPVWHDMLAETQFWQAKTFLYDESGLMPRPGNRGNDLHDNRRGKELFAYRCTVCHGKHGAGDGVAAGRMYPKPRDFTLALFKYKTTPGTELPTDDDLFNTIKNGLPDTNMPTWGRLLTDAQIRSLIPVIKSFDTTAAWAPDDTDDADFGDDGRYLKNDFRSTSQREPLPAQVPFSEASVAKGRPVFEKICGKCHGIEGRGNITSGKKLEDDWDNRIWPRDLTKPWTWRVTNVPGGGEKARDVTIKNIYTRLSIGLPGTPMPAHRATEAGNKDPISQEDRGHVANYVYSLRNQSQAPDSAAVLLALKVDGVLPDALNDDVWADVPAVTLSLLPNIIKNDPLHTPLNDAVTVRVLYNRDEIAFLLEVDDRTESRPGEKVATQIQDSYQPMRSDALAIQFPKQDFFSVEPAALRSLFRHGDSPHSTTMWYWNAGSVIPAVASQAMLLDVAGSQQRIVQRPLNASDNAFSVQAEWQHGQWRVLMKRPHPTGDTNNSDDVNFNEGDVIPVSFTDWDGSNGEIGTRQTRTDWHWLVLSSKTATHASFPLSLMIISTVFFLGLLSLWYLKKR